MKKLLFWQMVTTLGTLGLYFLIFSLTGAYLIAALVVIFLLSIFGTDAYEYVMAAALVTGLCITSIEGAPLCVAVTAAVAAASVSAAFFANIFYGDDQPPHRSKMFMAANTILQLILFLVQFAAVFLPIYLTLPKS